MLYEKLSFKVLPQLYLAWFLKMEFMSQYIRIFQRLKLLN